MLESTSGEQTLIVSKKSIKRIIFRYDEINRFFKVSAPIFSTQKQIKALFYEKEGQILALKTKKELPLSENLFLLWGSNLIRMRKYYKSIKQLISPNLNV